MLKNTLRVLVKQHYYQTKVGMFTLSCHKRVEFFVKSAEIAFSGVHEKIAKQNNCLLVTIQCAIFDTMGVKGLM